MKKRVLVYIFATMLLGMLLGCLPTRDILVVNCTSYDYEVELSRKYDNRIVKVKAHSVASIERAMSEPHPPHGGTDVTIFYLQKKGGKKIERRITLDEFRKTKFTLMLCNCDEGDK